MVILIHHFTVGNKNDCPSRKVVVTEDAQRFANQMNIPLFETSAKENINVEEMFLTITKMVSSANLTLPLSSSISKAVFLMITKEHYLKRLYNLK